MSNKSSVSRDSDSRDFYISPLSDWEVEKTLKREINKLYQVVSTNIKSSKLNDVIENELKFDSVNSLANNDVNNTLPIPYLFYTGGTVFRAIFLQL